MKNRAWILGAGVAALVAGVYALNAQTVTTPPVAGIACAYNTSPPTLTTGTAGWVQCDSTGKIITSGGGGGGGAVTVADGADVAQGTTTDGACAGDATSGCTALQRLSRIAARLTSLITALGSPFQAGGSIGNTTFGATQATAANLNATVVGTGTFAVQPGPSTSGGLSVYFVQPAASDNHVVIKAGAGQVYKVTATNNSATVNYLRLYNATTGFNGCNSATNLVYQVAIPASTSVGGISDSWDLGMAFATGISICVTSGYATTDTTNATASAMSVNVGYK